MRIPEDWDKPSPGNDRVAAGFEYGEYEDQGRLPYRIFKPLQEKLQKYPLTVYLHGADAFGNDNEMQLLMHDIGTMFATEAMQQIHPSYVLAPQCRAGGHWAGPGSGKRLMGLIQKLIKENPDIDEKRLYIYGYSAGGIGTLKILKDFPGIFAAAVPICAATDKEDLLNLTDIPIWLFHAEDDEIVKVSYKNSGLLFRSQLGSKDLYEELKDRAPKLKYTEYPAGFMKEKYGVNPHCSWVPVSQDKEMADWLFSKKLP